MLNINVKNVKEFLSIYNKIGKHCNTNRIII
jgi:hypothetical protein